MKWVGTICALAYVIVAVVTFGHSAASARAEERAEYSACLDRLTSGLEKACFDHTYAPIIGSVAAVIWPLYWSWELQE